MSDQRVRAHLRAAQLALSHILDIMPRNIMYLLAVVLVLTEKLIRASESSKKTLLYSFI